MLNKLQQSAKWVLIVITALTLVTAMPSCAAQKCDCPTWGNGHKGH
jgi:hypothetical protein